MTTGKTIALTRRTFIGKVISLLFNMLKSERLSVVSNSLRLHGLYSPWNSPGQNTGGQPIPSPADLPHPGYAVYVDHNFSPKE